MKTGFAKRYSLLQKDKMRDLFSSGYSLGYIARKFGCRTTAVWNNVFDIDPCWALSEERKKAAIKCSKISIKNVMNIRKLSHINKRKYNSIQLSKRYKVNQTTILGIIRGKTFRWVRGWIRPKRNDTDIYLRPIKIIKPRPLTDLIPGPKKGSHKTVKNGVIIRLAREYKLSASSICRKIKQGKIKL